MGLEAIQDPVSIFTPIYDNGSDVIELIDQICDNETMENKMSQERMIKEALAKLDEREKMIIFDRYFNDKTQMEIANELGISQAQVSRLEKNALKSMYDEIKWDYSPFFFFIIQNKNYFGFQNNFIICFKVLL